MSGPQLLLLLAGGLVFRAWMIRQRRISTRERVEQALRDALQTLHADAVFIKGRDEQKGEIQFINNHLSVMYTHELCEGEVLETVDMLFRINSSSRWVFGYRNEEVTFWARNDLLFRESLDQTAARSLAYELLLEVRKLKKQARGSWKG